MLGILLVLYASSQYKVQQDQQDQQDQEDQGSLHSLIQSRCPDIYRTQASVAITSNIKHPVAKLLTDDNGMESAARR